MARFGVGATHGVSLEHLDDFLRGAGDRADGAGLREFIMREFREFLTCGVLAHGFARVRCGRGRRERLPGRCLVILWRTPAVSFKTPI